MKQYYKGTNAKCLEVPKNSPVEYVMLVSGIKNNLLKASDNILGKYQAGFLKGRFVSNRIFSPNDVH